MGRSLQNLVTLLDGAPMLAAPSPALRRGQSLVEITLVMPILLIMLLGLIEIGWLANNFLILLDVTREAGRFGATIDPLQWNNGEEANLEHMDCNEFDGGSNTYRDAQGNPRAYLPVQDTSHLPAGRFVDGADGPYGYYDGVACAAIRNMDPLIFDPTRDDVVISVFSYLVEDFDGNGPQGFTIRVSGRFPPRQNECNDETYDPFDVNRNGALDAREDDLLYPWKMYDGNLEIGPGDNSENIRGYVLTGHHRVSDNPNCIGSEFSTAEIEARLNGASALENSNTPNNGVLLVEMFWHHRQLLQLPWFTTIGDNFEIHVWSLFPVSAAEPTATPN